MKIRLLHHPGKSTGFAVFIGFSEGLDCLGVGSQKVIFFLKSKP